jgi:YVTN family beta-propeller protein
MRAARSFGMSVISLFLLVLAGSCRTARYAGTEPVGQVGPQRYVTPVNQVLTPVGVQVELPGMRPQGLALSPDGRLLATSGKTQDLVLLDPQSGAIKQRVALPSSMAQDPNAVSSHVLEPDKSGQLSYTGLIFSPDGSRLYLSNVSGDVKVFGVSAEGQVKGLFSIALPEADAPRRKLEIPAGLALSRNGRRLYVVLNLSNCLAEVDTATGKVLRTWPVGVAPYDVVLVGNKAYVSNWGGRRPDDDSITGPAGRGTKVRVDPVRYIANEGSVSVIRLDKESPAGEIMVGLHSSALDRKSVV